MTEESEWGFFELAASASLGIVGWATRELHRDLVLAALRKALTMRRPAIWSRYIHGKDRKGAISPSTPSCDWRTTLTTDPAERQVRCG